MAQPAETFGTLATQLLLDRIAGRVRERRRVVVLPADLIVRRSSGAEPRVGRGRVTGTSRDGARLYGGIEAGGTKWVCAVGNGPSDMSGTTTFPTTAPDETIARAVEFFAANGALEAVGVGSFGPIERRRSSQSFGFITNTPKPGWAQTDVAGRLEESLDIPVAFDTDVNAAALGEQRWGAAVGLDSFCYFTVGTGIGGGVVVERPARPRPAPSRARPHADPARSRRRSVPGVLPVPRRLLRRARLRRGDAPEVGKGRARSSTTMRRGSSRRSTSHSVLMNVICALSPERIILGGGVMKEATLLARVQERLRELLAGYFDAPELKDRIGDFVVRAGPRRPRRSAWRDRARPGCHRRMKVRLERSSSPAPLFVGRLETAPTRSMPSSQLTGSRWPCVPARPRIYAARSRRAPQPCGVWSSLVVARSRPVCGSRGLDGRECPLRRLPFVVLTTTTETEDGRC